MPTMRICSAFVFAVFLVNCSSSSPPKPTQYHLGGTVSGLRGSGLVLHSSLGDDLAVTADGSFTFATQVSRDASYEVTVGAQPTAPWQTCTVAGGSGSAQADVTSVAVTCTTNTYAIGGTLTGLVGTGLVLHNGSDDLPVSASGPFKFPTKVASGATYAVTVAASPASPVQVCTVSNGSGTVAGADVSSIAITCSTAAFSVGGSVQGLTGTGLVLHNGSDDLPVSASGTFTFPTKVASGATYAVTVAVFPASPVQGCTVSNGSGTVTNADVSSVVVTCSTAAFSVGGSVQGLTGSGLVLQLNGANDDAIPANATSHQFPSLVASNTAYTVSVKTQPTNPSQTCTPANASGTVVANNVTNVNVSCVTNSFAVGGTISGLVSGSLVLHNGAEDLAITAGATTFQFATKVLSGATYAVTKTDPTAPSQTCTLTNPSGTVGAANVTNVAVSCTAPTVLQRWVAATTWGALSAWPDADAALLQHAHFEASGIVEKTADGIAWAQIPAVSIAAPSAANNPFPSQRFAAGPFSNGHYQASNDGGLDSLTGDFLVCAVFKPDLNPALETNSRVIVAKGFASASASGSGWVLGQGPNAQQADAFFFQYQNAAGPFLAFTQAHVGVEPANGPLNPSYEVVCAGRDANTIRIAANSVPDTVNEAAVPAGALASPALHHLTIGGYEDAVDASRAHAFGGKVYETAVWNIAATRANLQAKMAAVLGLLIDNGLASYNGVAAYSRPSEGPYGTGAADYHTAPWNAPRIDASKGLLFGLQGWNRVVNPEALNLWTATGGAIGSIVSADQDVPPGDSGLPSADRVTLAVGQSISPTLATLNPPTSAFVPSSAIYGQIWIKPIAPLPGTARLVISNSVVGGGGPITVDLAADLTAGSWNRVPLAGLASDAAGAANVSFAAGATNTGPIAFMAWGADLTQISGGSDLGAFDPGLGMYAWGNANNSPNAFDQDFLALPPLTPSTASTGYCLSVTAQTANGLAWDDNLEHPRTAMTWLASDLTASSDIHIQEQASPARLCVNTRHNADIWFTCSNTPPATAGPHTVKGCVAPNGAMTLYVDGVLQTNLLVGTSVGAPATVFVPDLAAGHVILGNGGTGGADRPWHGYVSGALVCGGTDQTKCVWP